MRTQTGSPCGRAPAGNVLSVSESSCTWNKLISGVSLRQYLRKTSASATLQCSQHRAAAARSRAVSANGIGALWGPTDRLSPFSLLPVIL